MKNMYNTRNKWIKLGMYMRTAIVKGCTDEEKLKRVALRYASRLFGNDYGIITNRELDKEIRAYINSFLYRIKEEVRKRKEPYENIDLNVVWIRLIENRVKVG